MSKEIAVEGRGTPEMAMGDVEMGDKGITTRASPLVRELKSRHLQMIAIGNNAVDIPFDDTLSDISRWCNWCWLFRWIW